ncbi:hypothetical protein [Caenispirillum bisanense]|uniref:Uncharacterized protein n=1 Tax=Caenispirillum bisanense TaxID=414052 RepID=A0A286GP10_9PROT|nr:hypothetical protein [Caenispirillum bisanense]SOD97242.1 hypothetical protein SAMN05421508_106348 [Caenispirillum bisanense]
MTRRQRTAVALAELPAYIVAALERQAAETDPEAMALDRLLTEDPGEWIPATAALLGTAPQPGGSWRAWSYILI